MAGFSAARLLRRSTAKLINDFPLGTASGDYHHYHHCYFESLTVGGQNYTSSFKQQHFIALRNVSLQNSLQNSVFKMSPFHMSPPHLRSSHTPLRCYGSWQWQSPDSTDAATKNNCTCPCHAKSEKASEQDDHKSKTVASIWNAVIIDTLEILHWIWTLFLPSVMFGGGLYLIFKIFF
jgi:hypothetical protein